MIKVEFSVEPGADVYAQIREWIKELPWLKYLAENHVNFEYTQVRDPDTYKNKLKLFFYLPPDKEVFFNLKYR